MCARKTVLM